MTNFEYYKDKILAISERDGIAMNSDGELVLCGSISCNDCSFCDIDGRCDKNLFKWLYSEYGENVTLIDEY